jgi:hypothetical protein
MILIVEVNLTCFGFFREKIRQEKYFLIDKILYVKAYLLVVMVSLRMNV